MDSFVFAPRNAAHCISGQNKWLETRGLLGMYAEDWTKCEKLARGPRREVDRWWETSAPINWGLMDKEAARSYSEAWIKEPMMKPRKVV